MILTVAEKKLGHTINEYDYKQQCLPPPMCYDMSNVRYFNFSLFIYHEAYILYFKLTNFLAREDVMEDLGVRGHKWNMCSGTVNKHVSYSIYVYHRQFMYACL